MLLTHGDVKTNPGPKKSHSYFSCNHWNVNSLIAHNKLKVSLLEAYNTVHKYDFICISETYLILRLNQKMMISESMLIT